LWIPRIALVVGGAALCVSMARTLLLDVSKAISADAGAGSRHEP
jgi:hypothetical protein